MRSMKVLLFQFLLIFPFSSSYYLDYDCVYRNGNYTSNSTYKHNLDNLLSQLATDTQIDYGFFNLSAGRQPDQVNLVALCRGDISFSDCHRCLNSTIEQIRQVCPDQKEAIMWVDTCMLRYTNRSIFNSMEESPGHYDCDAVNASDPTTLWSAVGGLLSDLQSQASKGDSRLKFAIREANVSGSSMKVYGLVQCTPDLSETDCYNCLHSTIDYLQQNCYGRIGAKDVEPNCISSVSFCPSFFFQILGREIGTLKAVIGVLSATAFLLFMIIVCLLIKLGRRGEGKFEKQFENQENGLSIESLQFDFSSVKAATGNFCQANKLGRGGFGSVYKVWGDWIEGRPLHIVDPVILDDGSKSSILRCIHIGLLCVQDDAANRPTMSEVDMMLRSQYFVLPKPSKPTYATNGNMKVPLCPAKGSSNVTDQTSKSTVSMEDYDTIIYPR
ncbi:hypothetical protein V2J09_006323 [Rumex salicifolius]